ncbi:hypothetical protein M8756_03025 [Lutimaribacter sp. EGI FJ00015]|uniref:Uncharacterized protein n=1 Tax=Lutimaribacter degradans TaxID=2945989 RepID=A0ACC5ZTB1_9RHOB|nr:hypothetical protein [Lutimaribacter sp. EGI FJ00013]MCM2560784.1 hypothetical protein [Lutimaribacter sp. EGI FJ00013]MCO0612270.1 hypothetical protein [Lutimaribacter sp. EGI FJ00015]MCO0634609.1 hypothetical protein [Lutimaribacter sp. EGI FJ00014]
MFRSLAISLALFAATPSLADFAAINGLRVVPMGDGARFEVIGRAGSGPQQYFCAAADYAQSVLGAPVAGRVSVAAPRGASQTRPGRRAVAFVVDDGPGRRAGDDNRYGLSVSEVGFNVSIGMARTSFCFDDDPLWLY